MNDTIEALLDHGYTVSFGLGENSIVSEKGPTVRARIARIRKDNSLISREGSTCKIALQRIADQVAKEADVVRDRMQSLVATLESLKLEDPPLESVRCPGDFGEDGDYS